MLVVVPCLLIQLAPGAAVALKTAFRPRFGLGGTHPSEIRRAQARRVARALGEPPTWQGTVPHSGCRSAQDRISATLRLRQNPSL